MEPIVPIVKTAKPALTAARGTWADLIASIIAAIAALLAFGYSALFFSRFLENDTHLWGILSAFLLCFGVGAFAYIPSGLTSLIAWRSYKNGATQRGLITSIVVILPWIVLSAALLFVSDLPRLYSLPILITVALLTAWSLISLRNFKAR